MSHRAQTDNCGKTKRPKPHLRGCKYTDRGYTDRGYTDYLLFSSISCVLFSFSSTVQESVQIPEPATGNPAETAKTTESNHYLKTV